MNPVSELPRTVGLSDRFPIPYIILRSFKAALKVPVFCGSFLATLLCFLCGLPCPLEGLLILFKQGRLVFDVLNLPYSSCITNISDIWLWPFLTFGTLSPDFFSRWTDGSLQWGWNVPCLYYFGSILLSILVWTFMGLAIQRIAVVRLTTGDSRSLKRGLKWAYRKYGSFWGAVILTAIPTVLIWLSAWGGLSVPFLRSYLFPLWYGLILTGFWVAWGTFFSFPLIGASLVSENGDAFDAASRSFSYATQKPLSLAACLFWTVFWGALGFWLVAAILRCGWIAATEFVGSGVLTRPGVLDGAESGAFVFWNFCLALILNAAFNAYLFTAVSGSYLILRHKIDDVELDEVYLSTPYGLPRHHLPDLIQEADKRQNLEEK